jgi:hypothetical protein
MRVHDQLRLRQVVGELVRLRGRSERRQRVAANEDGCGSEPETEERIDRAYRELPCGGGVAPQDGPAERGDELGGDQQRDPAEDAREPGPTPT